MDSYRRGVILTLRLNISSTLPDHNKNQGALQIWTIEAILLLVVVFILLGHEAIFVLTDHWIGG